MAEDARRITAEQLHERLPAERSSTELDQLREAFNETLARLERSFEQLRRFSADASHELRTPLTALRSVGEVGLRSARTVADYREVVGSMLEEVDRLTRLADELLTLARAEAGEARLRVEPVDLSALVRDVADRLSVLAEERGQTLDTRLAGSVMVDGDRLGLRQASNLGTPTRSFAESRSGVPLGREARRPAGENPLSSWRMKTMAPRTERSDLGPADWREETLARMRALILEADPEMIEERKWRKPSNAMAGVPVWSHHGIVCTGETYAKVVKLTFARGASLRDPKHLFNSSLEGNTRRAIDIHEGERVDAGAFKALVRAAVAQNGPAAKKR